LWSVNEPHKNVNINVNESKEINMSPPLSMFGNANCTRHKNVIFTKIIFLKGYRWEKYFLYTFAVPYITDLLFLSTHNSPVTNYNLSCFISVSIKCREVDSFLRYYWLH
jgi:hypothetical protein